MGQKVNPIGFRLNVNKNWESSWFTLKNHHVYLQQDAQIRKYLYESLSQAAISRIVIERLAKNLHVSIHSARPGVVIGKKGADIEKLRKKISALVTKDVTLNIVEVRKPELEARLVAESIAQQLERRISYRRAMKRAVQGAMKIGALGIKVHCSGRLGGAEIARTEKIQEGKVPLHTLRADVDFARATARTTYGTCGVQVWIYKGEAVYKNKHAMSEDKSVVSAVRG